MSENIFIATTGNGIALACAGESGKWEVDHLLPGQEVTCLATDPLDADVVYAGTQGNGLLRSNDKGRTWTHLGLEGKRVKAIAASPKTPGTIYAGTKPALIFVSRDGGATWREIKSFRRIPWKWLWLSPAEKPFIGYVQAIALSPCDPNVVLVGIEAGAVVRSADGGRSWSRHTGQALRDCHSLTFHASDGNWVYEGGGTGGGAAYSSDAGLTWTKLPAEKGRRYGWAVAGDPVRPDVWYVSLSPGPMNAHTDGKAEAYIYRSARGKKWQRLAGGLPQPLDNMPYALITDPREPGHVYAGLSNGDVWLSQDRGETWAQMPFNLGGIHRSLVIV